MRFRHHVPLFRGQLDVAPFVAVFLLLLLFLLFHSWLVFIPGVPISLPETVPLPGAQTPTVVVAVDKDGHFYFDNQICDEAQLRQNLAALVARTQPAPTLVVQADRQVRYERLVQLGLLAREAGVKQALLATRPQVTPALVPPAKP